MSHLCLLHPLLLKINQTLGTLSLREFWNAANDQPRILNKDLVHIFECTTRGFGVETKHYREVRVAKASKYYLWLAFCLHNDSSAERLTKKETPIKIVNSSFSELSHDEATHPVRGSGRGSSPCAPTERVDFRVEHPRHFGKAGAIEEVVNKEEGSSNLTKLWKV